MPDLRLSLSVGPDDWPGGALPWTGCDTLPRA